MNQIQTTLAAFLILTPTAFPQVPLEKDHAEKMARGTEIFKKHVRPMLVQQCLKCHGGAKTEGELDIADREHLLKGGDHGPAVVAGDPKKSLLFLMVAHEKKPPMPYKLPKLPDEMIRHVATWIENGAPYDSPLIERKDAAAWINKKVSPEARNHWAFQPLKPATPPVSKDNQWVKSDVDRFILAKLEAKGIRPNDAATKRQLIRRAYFDLIGLPPTADDVAAFEKDRSPGALATVVDKLLESPRYGERWARHWLDLARFAESHGFEHDYDRPSEYYYRDFVIKALNDGLPFNTFVRWQIAGDEIAPNNPQALFATGFLAAGVHSTQITKNEVEKHRYDELDDMLATTGTTMLGLTVGCARCHDHKYDPIPQADYYRLLSTFTATVRTETSVDIDPASYKLAKSKFDSEHAPLAKALADYESAELPKRFAEWEKSPAAKIAGPTWIVPHVRDVKSAGGATLTRQLDGSILVAGENPPKETLTFTLETGVAGINALRIEALTDPSLAKLGPGRAGNGNFCLTDVKVLSAPTSGKQVEIKLKNPRSTFDQKGLGVATAIDGDPNTTGWAVDPQFGFPQAASFEFEQPVGPGVITITLRFNNNVNHGMGRPRLSLANTMEPLKLDAIGILEVAIKALETPSEKRTPEQKSLLLERYKNLDDGWKKLDATIKAHLAKVPKPNIVKALISSEGVAAVRLHTQGEDVLKDTHFLNRGDPNQKVAVAQPGYLQVLFHGADKWKKDPPMGAKQSLRRSAFADWMTDPNDGAGHLLARVIVNRLWQKHMGRGIVATPSDFGVRGERPSHPELLDFLAIELIRNGWKLKPIHKLIVTSAVYQTNATTSERNLAADRDNVFFGRHLTRRLDAEVIRDSLLFVSGQLDETMFGPGTLDEGSKRRSIYFTMKRSKLIPMLVIFDAPDGTASIGDRPSTTIAPQALMLMNNPHVRMWARAMAKRVASQAVEESIHKAYRFVLSRDATRVELTEGSAFLATQAASYGAMSDARELALADLCQVVMCLNEMVYID